MAKFVKVCLIPPRCVVGTYDTKPDYEDSEHHKIVEYNFDESTELVGSLDVAEDGTVTNRHAGKTKAQAYAACEEEETQRRIAIKKKDKKRRIWSRTQEKCEAMDWKAQRAREKDLLEGTTTAVVEAAKELKAIRDEGNNWEAGVDALTTEAEVDAYSDKPPTFGKREDWKGVKWE